MYVALIPLVVGPLLCTVGSKGGDVTIIGLAYMSVGVLLSALKVVYIAKMFKTLEKGMGMVSFLFWLDLFMIPILAPWAVANGEIFAVAEWSMVGSGVAW